MSNQYNAFPPPPSPYGYPPQGPIVVTAVHGNKCPFCGEHSGNVVRATCGCVGCAWGVCLLFTVPILFWLPCCIDGCMDHEMVCPNCNGVKNVIPANCC